MANSDDPDNGLFVKQEVRIAVILPDKKKKEEIAKQAISEGRSMSNLMLRAYHFYVKYRGEHLKS